MEWLIAAIVGGLLGWVVYALYHPSQEEATLSHVVAGILGGLAGKWILASAWIVGSYIVSGTSFNLYSVLWAAIGGVVFAGVWRALTYASNGSQRITA